MKASTLLKNSVLAVVLLGLVGCTSTSTKQGTVGIKREQLLLISAAEMTQGAQIAYNSVLKEAKTAKKLNTDNAMVKRVRRIANRIIPQTAVFRDDAPNWAWEVNVLESKQLNAWCMPGGKIAFYTGIINKLKLTDAEIAAIMGHEIAHALREHGRERASEQTLTQVGLSALSIFTGVQGPALDAASMALQVTLTLPNSRTHEVEADRMGVELAARAGYNPYAAVNVWKKMDKESKGGRPPEILSTHPSHSSRIKDLTKYAKRVEPLFQKALKKAKK
ncbi:M48 family metallopeptidase [Thiomicrorhabdus lithotrophica]|uniref:M48 family metallopeptidase n=1 Tax=Thiomicrorhabdus lithotrophica TaxID=2949997 RepID=A0ABY8C9N1_9GAMM|nr:M48 family metallopeptidase [Thiomicrorhabdus lithotrophica]WEJ62676.1 M48 family metallopeptidase [Thiomicrorhabdus lithotrophica]